MSFVLFQLCCFINCTHYSDSRIRIDSESRKHQYPDNTTHKDIMSCDSSCDISSAVNRRVEDEHGKEKNNIE